MKAPFTARQGDYLAFIHRFTTQRGVAPSFEEIAAHFGTSAPSVNGMIKTLERRQFLSRVPGVARSLRVLVPAAALPESDFGSQGRRRVDARPGSTEAASPVDIAVVAATAVIDVVMPHLDAENAPGAVMEAASALRLVLVKSGLADDQAIEVARRVAAEAARWQVDGRGVQVRRRRWVRRSG
jgi:repressor LexA